MTRIFHGDDERTHEAFQSWRRENVNGYCLTEKTAGQFVAHYTQDRRENREGRGCAHQGESSIKFRADNEACYTRARKVCANDFGELVAWALMNGFVIRNCRHCDSKRFPFPEVSSGKSYALPEELDEVSGLKEGALRKVTVNAYERNPEARRRCLEHYGTTCAVCGFDFGAAYGPVAEGFIHVHHIRSLAEIGEAYEVDPIKDLRPVCPNCHAVVHLGGGTRGLGDVRSLLTEAKASPTRQ